MPLAQPGDCVELVMVREVFEQPRQLSNHDSR